MILVTTEPQPGSYPVELDAGIAVSHMALAATSLGLNSCIVAMPGVAFQNEDLKAKYIPQGFDFTIALLLGYAANPGGTPHEPDFSKIIYM
jgi:nitroreductase